MVFQSYALWPHMSVIENVKYGLNIRSYAAKEQESKAMEALGVVQMEHLAKRKPNELSGGQQQRILIARALAQQPQILLLDEPTTGIDTTTQHTVLELIRRLHRELKLTILLVTHDINLISPLVDRLILLNTHLFANGHPNDVLQYNILSQVYGNEIIVTDNGYVIGGDSHHG